LKSVEASRVGSSKPLAVVSPSLEVAGRDGGNVDTGQGSISTDWPYGEGDVVSEPGPVTLEIL